MLQSLEPCVSSMTRRLDDKSLIRRAFNKLLTSLNFENALGSQEIKLTSIKRLSGVADQDWFEVDKVDNQLLAKVERCPLKPDLGWGRLEGVPCHPGSLVVWGLTGSLLQPEEHFLGGFLWTDAATQQNYLLSLLFA